MKKLLSFGIIFLLIACAATGVKVSDEQLSKLKKGETTPSQAIAILGSPVHTSKTEYGTILTYSYAEYSTRAASLIPVVGIFAGGGDMKTSAVTLRFGKDNLLSAINTSESQHGIGRGFSAGSIDTAPVDQPRQ